jgi:hypothetical protein
MYTIFISQVLFSVLSKFVLLLREKFSVTLKFWLIILAGEKIWSGVRAVNLPKNWDLEKG